MLLCSFSIGLSTHSLALVSGSLCGRVSSTKLTEFYLPPSCSILLFFFCYFSSIPKPAVIPTVRGCCLTAPDLWNDDGGAWAPYPSVFIAPFCPRAPSTTISTTASRMLHWAVVVVTLTVTDVSSQTGLETPPPPTPKSSQLWPQPADWVPWQGLYRLEVR